MAGPITTSPVLIISESVVYYANSLLTNWTLRPYDAFSRAGFVAILNYPTLTTELVRTEIEIVQDLIRGYGTSQDIHKDAIALFDVMLDITPLIVAPEDETNTYLYWFDSIVILGD